MNAGSQLAKKRITPEDLMPMEKYSIIRRDLRRALIKTKAQRRAHVGPFATFHFENYETMWAQVQEMLYIEKGGLQQIQDELEAYNPLIPQGSQLITTLLIEIEDPVRRQRLLSKLGNIENNIILSFEDQRVVGQPHDDVERTNAEGKTSAVHFLTFNFTKTQTQLFKDSKIEASLRIEHENYLHACVLLPKIKSELSKDLD